MRMRRLFVTIALLALLQSIAFAEPAKSGFFYDQNLQASYNPLGLQFVSKLYFRVPLVKAKGLLWESTKLDFGIQNNLSPSYDLVGAFVNIEPIAIFSLNATAQLAGFYKALGFGFYDISSYTSGFDSAALSPLTARDTSGYVLSVAPTLKAAFGPVAVLDTGTLTYYNVDNGQGYFYERIGNTVLAKRDIELSNSGYLLYTLKPGLLAGLNDSIMYVPASGYLSHRLNAIGVYTRDLNAGLSLYGAFMMGTFLADEYYQYALYVAGQIGFTLRLSPRAAAQP
jgi:hypothetical protein